MDYLIWTLPVQRVHCSKFYILSVVDYKLEQRLCEHDWFTLSNVYNNTSIITGSAQSCRYLNYMVAFFSWLTYYVRLHSALVLMSYHVLRIMFAQNRPYSNVRWYTQERLLNFMSALHLSNYSSTIPLLMMFVPCTQVVDYAFFSYE